MSEKKIKYKLLDENIPKTSELYDYLSNKRETTSLGNAKTMFQKKKEPIPIVKRSSSRFPLPMLILPPIILSEGTVKRVIPPLGLAYMAGTLKDKKIPYEILDCVVEGPEHEEPLPNKNWSYGLPLKEIRSRIEQVNPDVVFLSIVYSSDLPSLYNVAKLVKEIDRKIIVVAGGIHASIYPWEVFEEANENGRIIDFIIRGEGEYRGVEFLTNLNEGYVDANADGLCGIGDDFAFKNHQMEVIEDLDKMPFPDYTQLPMEKYFAFNVPFSPFPRGKRVMQIYTSRGCPVGCTFCASTNFNKKFRARSPDNIIEEIKHYKELFDIDEIQFADDNLTFDRKRSIELFTKLKELNLQWCTPNGIMINTLSKDLIDLMIECGLYQITLSIDSGNEKTLKEEHRKPVDLSKVPDLSWYLAEKGILVHATLVVGMPNETIEDIKEGFRYTDNIYMNSIGVFLAQALPGSELYEKVYQGRDKEKKMARHIDTARALHKVSPIDTPVLEKLIADFLYQVNKKLKARDPLSWQKKYEKHKDRLSKITIGSAAPNSDGIIQAAEPAPNELF